jgi:hypothetical protein
MMLHLLASTQHESSPLHWQVNFALRFLLKLLSSLAISLTRCWTARQHQSYRLSHRARFLPVGHTGRRVGDSGPEAVSQLLGRARSREREAGTKVRSQRSQATILDQPSTINHVLSAIYHGSTVTVAFLVAVTSPASMRPLTFTSKRAVASFVGTETVWFRTAVTSPASVRRLEFTSPISTPMFTYVSGNTCCH